jgi:deoxyribonuclease V
MDKISDFLEKASLRQKDLEKEIILENKVEKEKIECIGGMDVSYSKEKDNIYGVVVLLRYPSLEFITYEVASKKVSFPYIPGFLCFREGDVLIDAFFKLKERGKVTPQVILCDGQGIAHPRKLGLATYVGIQLKLPTIGVAKKPLIWKGLNFHLNNLKYRGEYSFLEYKGEKLGIALVTRNFVKPVFVSPGWGISIDTARSIVLDSTSNYRIPEPIRWADRLSKLSKENIKL